MPTHITQIEDPETGRSILRVDGQLLRDDAVLLDRIAQDIAQGTGRSVDIDLADVDFIDSEAASILKGLQSIHGFELTGVEILLQNAINEAERQ
jgi:anti-anti-sigma regulatory factor